MGQVVKTVEIKLDSELQSTLDSLRLDIKQALNLTEMPAEDKVLTVLINYGKIIFEQVKNGANVIDLIQIKSGVNQGGTRIHIGRDFKKLIDYFS